MVELNPNIAQRGGVATMDPPKNDPNATTDLDAPEINEAGTDQETNQTQIQKLNQAPKPEIKNNHDHYESSRLLSGFSFIEFLGAIPMLFTSLVSQARNITRHATNTEYSGLIGFTSTVIAVISSGFRKALDLFIVQSNKENDVSVNQRSFATQDITRRLAHPNVVEEFISFLFSAKRTLFAFTPNFFTVPSQEHDPNNPDGNPISGGSAKIWSVISTLYKPFGIASALMTGIIAIPSQILSLCSSYYGNQETFNLGKYFSNLSETLLPITSHLSTISQVAKATAFSLATGASRKVAFGRYNINFLHVFQALIGAVTGVPYFFGSLVNFRDVLARRDSEGKLLLANNIRELARFVIPQLKEFGLYTNESIAAIEERWSNYTERQAHNLSRQTHELLNRVLNNKWVKILSSSIMPTDIFGNVHSESEFASNENELARGGIRKSGYFKNLYQIIHPIQSLVMLLPNAFVALNDSYITDNATRSIRAFDRLIGVNSMILSLPNFLIYALSTRVPQVIIKIFELLQNRAIIQGNNSYNAYESYRNLIDICKQNHIFGSGYLAEALESLDVNERTFHDPYQIRNIFESLDQKARQQEPSVKASELVNSTRIGMRTILSRQGIFFAKRDAEGLTDDEHSRKNFHQKLGTIKEGIGGIPILGWIAGPLIELLRKRYEVQPRDQGRYGFKQEENTKPLESTNKKTAMAA